MDKINLNELGINYTILDKDTEETECIRVIDAKELLSVIGVYIGTDKDNIWPPMSEIVKCFRGFARSPYHITWYVGIEGQFDISQAIFQARREKNQIVITEILPADKEITGFENN